MLRSNNYLCHIYGISCHRYFFCHINGTSVIQSPSPGHLRTSRNKIPPCHSLLIHVTSTSTSRHSHLSMLPPRQLHVTVTSLYVTPITFLRATVTSPPHPTSSPCHIAVIITPTQTLRQIHLSHFHDTFMSRSPLQVTCTSRLKPPPYHNRLFNVTPRQLQIPVTSPCHLPSTFVPQFPFYSISTSTPIPNYFPMSPLHPASQSGALPLMN